MVNIYVALILSHSFYVDMGKTTSQHTKYIKKLKIINNIGIQAIKVLKQEI